jgi:hypothetical protein
MEMPKYSLWVVRMDAFRAALKPIVAYGGWKRAVVCNKSRKGKDKMGEGRLLVGESQITWLGEACYSGRVNCCDCARTRPLKGLNSH